MENKTPIQTRLGSVAYTLLGVRQSTLKHFFIDFDIHYLDYSENTKPCSFKDLILTSNFVFFLIENKTFILLYQSDYYSNKSIEIIANKVGKPKENIIKLLAQQGYEANEKYPYRYKSSYGIDFELDQKKYKFLSYNTHHRYEGNYEYRRADYSN